MKDSEEKKERTETNIEDAIFEKYGVKVIDMSEREARSIGSFLVLDREQHH